MSFLSSYESWFRNNRFWWLSVGVSVVVVVFIIDLKYDTQAHP